MSTEVQIAAPGLTAGQAQERARRLGLGAVQVSPRRYVVVVSSGASATRWGNEEWLGRVSYRTVTRPIEWRLADQIMGRLFAADGVSYSEYDNELHRVLQGPHRPEWRS